MSNGASCARRTSANEVSVTFPENYTWNAIRDWPRFRPTGYSPDLSVQRLIGFRILCDDLEQRPDGPGGLRASLLPVLQRARVHANQFHKLAQADLGRLADGAHVSAPVAFELFQAVRGRHAESDR